MNEASAGNVLRICFSKRRSQVVVLETSCLEIKRVVKNGVSALYTFVDSDTV